MFESFTNLFKKPRKICPTVPALPMGITREQWTASATHVTYAQKLWSDPMFQQMMGLVQHSLVIREPTQSTAERELGRALGKQGVMILLWSLQFEAPKNEPLPASEYLPEEPETENV